MKIKEGIEIYKISLTKPVDGSFKKVKISTNGDGKPFIKQLKSFNSVWGNCQFYINEEIPECDLWVVYGGLYKKESVIAPKDGAILITTEPEEVKKYSKKFLSQFHAVITCQENIHHSHRIDQQQSLPWWVGHKVLTDEAHYSKTYDELKALVPPTKNKLASIIVSNKIFTRGHKKRYEFFIKLTEKLGDKIDIFGIGSNTIDDKWDAIANYKYHIVLENNLSKDYFTEKLSDTFLGLSYPIYCGCKNIYRYFPSNSLSTIDINNTEESIEKIAAILESDIYEKSKEALEQSKNLILDEYQIFPMLCKYMKEHTMSTQRVTQTIKPESENKFLSSVKKLLRILTGK